MVHRLEIFPMPGLSRSSHALVTGGARGIGREVAATLSRAGASVTVVGRNREALDAVVAEGLAHFAIVADVADEAALSRAVATAGARQPIDILVANAGAAESAPFAKSDPALFRRMWEVNFLGVVHAAQAALPSMKTLGRGRIIAIASTAGLKGYPYVTAYAAAKHAVVGLVRSLALELAPLAITVNGLRATVFPSLSLRYFSTSSDWLDIVERESPLGPPPVEKVAETILLLCSPAADYITGQVVNVDGGWLTSVLRARGAGSDVSSSPR